MVFRFRFIRFLIEKIYISQNTDFHPCQRYNYITWSEIKSRHKYWLVYCIHVVVLPNNKIHSFNNEHDHQEQNNIMRNDKKHPTHFSYSLHHHPIMSSLILSCEHNSTSTSSHFFLFLNFVMHIEFRILKFWHNFALFFIFRKYYECNNGKLV